MMHCAAYELKGPVAIRYPRGTEIPLLQLPELNDPQLSFVSYSAMTAPVQAAVQMLRDEGYRVNFLRLTQIAPMDWAQLEAVQGPMLVVEDCVQTGCVGEAIAAHFAGSKRQITLCNLGDQFVTHGAVNKLYESLGMDAAGLVKRAKEVLGHGESQT